METLKTELISERDSCEMKKRPEQTEKSDFRFAFLLLHIHIPIIVLRPKYESRAMTKARR